MNDLQNLIVKAYQAEAGSPLPAGIAKTAQKMYEAITGMDTSLLGAILWKENKVSRAVFENVVLKGKLPKTNSGMQAVVDKFISDVRAGVEAAAIAKELDERVAP